MTVFVYGFCCMSLRQKRKKKGFVQENDVCVVILLPNNTHDINNSHVPTEEISNINPPYQV